jgi:hypothetical protein
VFELPVTDAVNVVVALVDIVVVSGEIPTVTTAAVTVIVAVADFVASAALVAVSVYVPAEDGAV